MKKKTTAGSDLDTDGCKNVAAAIVEQAAKDYLKAVRRLHKFPNCADAKCTARECEHFFRHDVGLWTNIDGETIIRAINDKAVNGGSIKKTKM